MWDLIRLSAQPVRVLVRPSEEAENFDLIC